MDSMRAFTIPAIFLILRQKFAEGQQPLFRDAGNLFIGQGSFLMTVRHGDGNTLLALSKAAREDVKHLNLLQKLTCNLLDHLNQEPASTSSFTTMARSRSMPGNLGKSR